MHLARADAYFKQRQYSEAARCFAESSRPLEEVALGCGARRRCAAHTASIARASHVVGAAGRFIEMGEHAALKTYLLHKLPQYPAQVRAARLCMSLARPTPLHPSLAYRAPSGKPCALGSRRFS